MAKSFTLYERPIGNSNPVAVAVPNKKDGGVGSLPINTYYYKVIANGYSDFYEDVDAWLSAPSVEVSALTDATNRVVWIRKIRQCDDSTRIGERSQGRETRRFRKYRHDPMRRC